MTELGIHPSAQVDATPGEPSIRAITDVGSSNARMPQVGRIFWQTSASESTDVHLEYSVEGTSVRITADLMARDDAELSAGLTITCRQGFGVVLYENGIIQRTPNQSGWVTSSSPLHSAYAMSPTIGSAAVEPANPMQAVGSWREGDESFEVTLIAAGSVAGIQEGYHAGAFDVQTHTKPTAMRAGDRIVLSFVVTVSATAAPPLARDAVAIPDEQDRTAHELALWGSQVPSLGSLEVRGSAYPTVNLPRREYGSLHTFFDPDAWSVTASLSYSGVPYLEQQARAVIERALSHIDERGLVPHHFDGEDATYIAISGSPQPGPNLFLLEAAVDHACATGDVDWLMTAWKRGLRASTEWLLHRFDPERGLLRVVGALWVDVFRRAGYTLDTNAMAVRTLGRAAEVADLAGDRDMAERLRHVVDAIRGSLQSLWAATADHFVTSRSNDWQIIDDHVDAENYLAVATGAAAPEQATAILALFDSHPLTHPGDRGTWVSLRRYDGEDCYLHNTGDSDIAMARLWWADLMARRAVGDREGFFRFFEPVRRDLLQLVWMRERYSAGGHMTRARGYHEYPDLVDMLIREAIYGVAVGVGSVEIAPMRDAPFSVRFGRLSVIHGPERVRLTIPPTGMRRAIVRGLMPASQYRCGDALVASDEAGTVTVMFDGSELELLRVG